MPLSVVTIRAGAKSLNGREVNGMAKEDSHMRCSDCGKTLLKVDRREEMAELGEDATEGQEADYTASELSGDNGAWNIGIVEYCCSGCGRIEQVQSEYLPNYRDLILGWHEKAKDGDPFSRFVFEYLAFIAHLKNNIFFDEPSDRGAIQALKRDSLRRGHYLARVQADLELSEILNRLIKELMATPLLNSSRDLDFPEIDRWWNCSDPQLNQIDAAPKGVIRSADDWENMVELWYSVRNNLFHGGKDPNIRRDCFLVEHAYETSRAFMELESRDL